MAIVGSVRLVSILTALCCIGLAERPIATITSSDAFELSGVRVPVAGVPQWPLVSGDEVVTGDAPALVSFADGSRVTMNARSRVKLQASGKETVLRLLKGDMAYKVTKSSPVKLAALSKDTLLDSSGEGLLSTDGSVAVWSPLSASMMRAAQGNPAFFAQYRMSPFNLNFMDQWRKYKLGGPVPPAPATQPPGLPAWSINKP
jgi:hypothetical protein